MMANRFFASILLILSVFLCIREARAQVARVAVLTPYSQEAEAQGWGVFVAVLKQRGWIEGNNISFDIRRTGGRPELFQQLAAELVTSRPDVIIGVTSQSVQALREHTTSIPILMRGAGDPIGSGFVASLARPGGNITGPSSQLGDLTEKSLQLLSETRPGITRVSVLWTPENAPSRLAKDAVIAAGSKFGMTIESVPVNTPDEIAPALALMARDLPDALIVHSTPVLLINDQPIISFAARHRLPTLTSNGIGARDGLLLSYAPDTLEQWRIDADYADRILKGAKAADLPVQQPTKFELVVNLKTAKVLDLTVPQSLLVQADEVIE
jgi:putative ABC transport system substrate-binding protein